MSESQLVRRVRELFSGRIGDDAAVVGDQVLTTDMLIEDVDFTKSIPLRLIARKSLAVNLSDLAAMGAEPTVALVGLALPPWALANVDEILTSLASFAKEYGIEIVGGDFSRADKLTIAITAIGRVVGRPLLRSTAKPGDRIFLSRTIGGSGTGLSLLGRGWTATGTAPAGFGFSEREFGFSAIQRHVDPQPEIEVGLKLAAMPEVTSCIDVSDGLSTDLHHLCEASGCGAEIERERLPVMQDLLELAPSLGVNVADVVLNGGEEYALLFTARGRESEMSRKLGRPVYAIGRMTAATGVMLVQDGVPRPLVPAGFDHFSGAS